MLSTCKKFSLLLAVCGVVPLAAQDDNSTASSDDRQHAVVKTPREQYEALLQEYQTQFAEYRKAATATKTHKLIAEIEAGE